MEDPKNPRPLSGRTGDAFDGTYVPNKWPGHTDIGPWTNGVRAVGCVAFAIDDNTGIRVFHGPSNAWLHAWSRTQADEYLRKYYPNDDELPVIETLYTFEDYEADAQATRLDSTRGDNEQLYPILGLLGEAGEIANKYKKVLRDHGIHGGVPRTIPPALRDALLDECGDVLWYLTALVSDLKSTLADVARNNTTKLQSRKSRGVLGGSGDKR